MALNRMVEEAPAWIKKTAKLLGNRPKPTLSAGRRMADGKIVEKLRSLQLEVDPTILDKWSREFPSAEALMEWLLSEGQVTARDEETDWVWIGLTVLWERWFPDRTNFEMLDDRMQDGYRAFEKNGTATCKVWLNVWKDVLAMADAYRLRSIEDFDDAFGGTQSLFNWVQDLVLELENAGREDKRFLRERIAVCGECLRRWPGDDALLTENMKADMARSHHALGETDKAVALLQSWLAENPQWGWGWIAWADCFRWAGEKPANLAEAERILKEALAIPDLRDRAAVLDRLAELLEDTNRPQDASALREEIARLDGTSEGDVDVFETGKESITITTAISRQDEGIPIEDREDEDRPVRTEPPPFHQKIGRNDPCPCGSGKKFKKCCGRSG